MTIGESNMFVPETFDFNSNYGYGYQFPENYLFKLLRPKRNDSNLKLNPNDQQSSFRLNIVTD